MAWHIIWSANLHLIIIVEVMVYVCYIYRLVCMYVCEVVKKNNPGRKNKKMKRREPNLQEKVAKQVCCFVFLLWGDHRGIIMGMIVWFRP